jgi:hypothetical protein
VARQQRGGRHEKDIGQGKERPDRLAAFVHVGCRVADFVRCEGPTRSTRSTTIGHQRQQFSNGEKQAFDVYVFMSNVYVESAVELFLGDLPEPRRHRRHLQRAEPAVRCWRVEKV